MHHAPEVDVHRDVPVLERRPHAAAGPARGVVHQQADLAEPLVDRVPERLEIGRTGDIRGHGQNVLLAFRGALDEPRMGRLQLLAIHVRHTDLHAQAGEPPAGGKADAHGGAGHHGDAAGFQDGMGHGEASLAGSLVAAIQRFVRAGIRISVRIVTGSLSASGWL